jgi:gliding motility-associated-like protein
MRNLSLLFIVVLFSCGLLEAKDKHVEIKDQKSLSTKQGQAITIHLSDLIVEDPDHEYPNGFELKVFGGKNYVFSGQTITPDANFTGTLRVPVWIVKGKDKSKKFDVQIQVLPIVSENKAPTILGQVSLSTTENKAIEIFLSNLIVNDPDDVYPNGFTLKILSGENYSVANFRVTPARGFVGTLTVSVKVNDGKDDSPVFSLKIIVNEDVNLNMRPVITGQIPLTINKNESLPIQFSHLVVNDANNSYPNGFGLKVYPGANYSISNTVITPATNFTGILSVKVSVTDGVMESDPFNLKITVLPGSVNQPPVITGQVGLSTFKNQSLTIVLSHLVVKDPDNTYPDDFNLNVLPGDNYAASGSVITPTHDFVGTLSVGVTVSDGNATSKAYYLSVRVLNVSELQIVGQKPLTIKEDSSITLSLADLIVNDPQGKYPTAFSMRITTNENFTADNLTIKPSANFNGNLVTSISVSNGVQTSAPFNLLIVVQPANDAPQILQLESETLLFSLNADPLPITDNAIVSDIDDDNLVVAEIGFGQVGYQPDNDELLFANTENIRGVFDPAVGILTFIGEAPLSEYQEAIRSVRYNFINVTDSTVIDNNKSIYIKLNDGKALSDVYTRSVSISKNIAVNIPNAFTPNDDNANDTWIIEPLEESAGFKSAIIRVYTRSGKLVYQSDNFEAPWDGRLNGELLPPDSYFYTIQVDLNYTKKSYKGIVTILR